MAVWCGSSANRVDDAARMVAPSAARNRAAILQALRPHLPATGTVLEVASGTGEHVAHFAAALPGAQWQPSDPDAERRASIDAWCAGLPNVRPAVPLDATAPTWPVDRADAVLCINMIHIAPWPAAGAGGRRRPAAASGRAAGALRPVPARRPGDGGGQRRLRRRPAAPRSGLGLAFCGGGCGAGGRRRVLAAPYRADADEQPLAAVPPRLSRWRRSPQARRAPKSRPDRRCQASR